MAWVLDRSHQLVRPSVDGLAALVRECAPRSTVARVRRLGGGLSTGTYAIDLRSPAGNIASLVMKRFRPGDTSAPEEWVKLRFARRAGVASPEPVALDRRGEWFGAPAIVMTKLPGRPYLTPSDNDSYLRQLAEATLAIQATPIGRAPASIRKVHPRIHSDPRAGMRRSDLVERAALVVARDRDRAGVTGLCLGHGDLHPGNTLWLRGRLSGIVDWRHASVAPRAYDVAYTRVDLAVLLGIAAADRYLHWYATLWGRELDDLHVWDLHQGLAAMRYAHYWAVAYREQGRRDLTDAKARRRARDFVREILRRLA